MKTLLLIGIGAGDPDYLTAQAIAALNRAEVFFLLDKGPAKQALIAFREQVCQRYIDASRPYRFVEANSPERERGGDYATRVEELNRAKQQVFEQLIEQMADGECGAFLVWGDPALYDSTSRILGAILAEGRLAFDFEVIPGISSVQALAARHKVALNEIGQPVLITTGRRLLAQGVAAEGNTVVMLDAEDSYLSLRGQGLEIYWGAYLGTPQEILMAGLLDEVGADIQRTRLAARAEHGWIMDTYLLRRPSPRSS
ncbi:precorrin-6A synthase (deacetylating) [Pseudomonas sp. NPDC007930]|uniref:precorrin-6A synthase (deacetylating) n=1 Tax=Pseudomonas sp. NPDC007930 TaxID=3364417 RepID=UPI0036E69921